MSSPNDVEGSGASENNEEDEAEEFFSDPANRRVFVRNVFAILTLQLLMTFVYALVFSMSKPVSDFVKSHSWITWVSMLLMIVYTVGLAFIEEERRYPAWNYIVLGLFTLSQGFLVFVLSVTFDTGMVMFVLVLATFLTLMLCIFNVQTRTAFDYRSGIIYVCVIMVILFPLTALLGFRQPTLIVTFVLVYGVVLLFGIYIVFDMHLIVNRAHLFEYSPDEYIFATLNFYTDIVMLTLAIISNVLERAQQQQQQQPKTAAPAQPRRKSSPTRKSLSRTRRSRSPPQKNQTSKGKTTADTSSSKTTTPNT